MFLDHLFALLHSSLLTCEERIRHSKRLAILFYAVHRPKIADELAVCQRLKKTTYILLTYHISLKLSSQRVATMTMTLQTYFILSVVVGNTSSLAVEQRPDGVVGTMSSTLDRGTVHPVCTRP